MSAPGHDEMVRKGTCQLCGEPDVDLHRGEELPEEFEGVGCLRCCEYHAQEADRRHEREQFKKEMRRW